MSDQETQPVSGQPRQWWRPALAAGGVVAIVAGGAYVVDRAGDGEVAAADAGPLAALTVHDGDSVTAVGVIVEEPGEARQVCTLGPSDLMIFPPGEEPPYACSPLAVPITGGEGIELPSWIERDGVWFTQTSVTVEGVWRDGAIDIDSVAEAADGADAQPLDEDFWRVPCEAPAGGWADGDGRSMDDPAEYERVGAALSEELTAHPELYFGQWIGYPDGDPMASGAPMTDMGEPIIGHQVMIVSTVDDVTTTQARLAAMYPGNLCVTRAEHSTAEFDALAQQLAAYDDSWQADAHSLQSSTANRLQLTLPVLDEAAVAEIGADAALVEVRSLVRPS